MKPITKDKRRVYRVEEINRLAKYSLEDNFGTIWVEGEISNLSQPQSGHIYFTLKDSKGQLKAALFRGNQRELSFRPKNGMKILAFGVLTIYELSGQYQLLVRKLEESGIGSLHEAFEKLKEKLSNEGLFAPEIKQLLPILPRHIGIVTSPTGAAIRDILNIIERRFPNLHVVIAPAAVQGNDAADEIVSGIQILNARDDIEVIIIGRGGGSLEDLWCFNEEKVARAVAASKLPVISAVGHETDFTISDFVADVRAPTPSAAAELVIGRKEEFEKRITSLSRDLASNLKERELLLRNRLIAARESYVFREPLNIITNYSQHIDRLAEKLTFSSQQLLSIRRQLLEKYSYRLAQTLQKPIKQYRRKIDELRLTQTHQIESVLSHKTLGLKHINEQLKALNPIAILNRGYSVTRNAAGTIITSSNEVDSNDMLETQLAKGKIISKVT